MTRDDSERLSIIEQRLARMERVLSELYRDRSRGFVYVVTDGQGRYKIGVARNVEDRMKALATGSVTHQLLLSIETDDQFALEKALHTCYRNAGRHIIREWYALAQPDIDSLNSLAQPVFGETLPGVLAGVATSAQQCVSIPVPPVNGAHPTAAAARALVQSAKSAQVIDLFLAGKSTPEIVQEVYGPLNTNTREYREARAEVEAMMRRLLAQFVGGA